MSYTVVGISSGGGVSLYPFRKQVLMNIEQRPIFYTPKNIQWQLNFGDTPLLKDFPKKQPGKVDVVLASPDCGSGSILRMSRAKEYGNHQENKSLALFFRGIELYGPKLFLFENLDGLFKSFPEADFDSLLSDYHLIKHVAPVSMWGNSQVNRERLIIVGVHKDLSPRFYKYFKMPDYRDKNKTCWDLYGDLDGREDFDLGHVREDLDELITIYAGKKMTIKEIKAYWQNELKGEKRWKVTDRKFTTAPGVYRNKKRDYPATARKANRQFDHHGLMLTPRQLARIQGVPDDFKLYIEPERRNFWINKGRALVTKTPPMEISTWFKRKLEKLPIWQ